MQTTTIQFSKEIYTVDTIKKAAYRFTNEASFVFNIVDNNIICDVTLVKDDSDPSEFSLRFNNEVLDQDLREKVANETESIRNVVLSYTFSKVSV